MIASIKFILSAALIATLTPSSFAAAPIEAAPFGQEPEPVTGQAPPGCKPPQDAGYLAVNAHSGADPDGDGLVGGRGLVQSSEGLRAVCERSMDIVNKECERDIKAIQAGAPAATVSYHTDVNAGLAQFVDYHNRLTLAWDDCDLKFRDAHKACGELGAKVGQALRQYQTELRKPKSCELGQQRAEPTRQNIARARVAVRASSEKFNRLQEEFQKAKQALNAQIQALQQASGLSASSD